MYTWGIFLAYIRRRPSSRLRFRGFRDAGRDTRCYGDVIWYMLLSPVTSKKLKAIGLELESGDGGGIWRNKEKGIVRILKAVVGEVTRERTKSLNIAPIKCSVKRLGEYICHQDK